MLCCSLCCLHCLQCLSCFKNVALDRVESHGIPHFDKPCALFSSSFPSIKLERTRDVSASTACVSGNAIGGPPQKKTIKGVMPSVRQSEAGSIALRSLLLPFSGWTRVCCQLHGIYRGGHLHQLSRSKALSTSYQPQTAPTHPRWPSRPLSSLPILPGCRCRPWIPAAEPHSARR